MMILTVTGCNKNDEAAIEEGTQPEGQVDGDNAMDGALADVLGQGEEPVADQQGTAQPQQENDNDNGAEEPPKTAVAEKSPVEITRIDMGSPLQSTASDLPAEEENKDPAPNLFEITECQVEINGIYQVKMARDLLKEINKRRAEYGISPLRQNTSLLACADSRCKEQTYFVGHFRPDGSPFTSVSPEGYVKGECVSVHFSSVNDIMEDWFAVNKSRMQIMHPDYTQCGISIYDINGTLFLAAEFSY